MLIKTNNGPMFWNGGAIWGTLDVLFGVDEFEDGFFLRGYNVISQKMLPKVDLRCVDVGKGLWAIGC